MALASLGSTGSIGENTLDVIARNRDTYRVVALTANRNIQRLAEQCALHGASHAVTADPTRYRELVKELDRLGCNARPMAGTQALVEVAEMDASEAVMAAIVGAAGLPPTLQAARSGKRVMLANKEAMVIAGPLFREAVRSSGARIVPVDSEHNALFQVLPDGFEQGLTRVGVQKLILTASGGPFLDLDRDALEAVTPDQACRHPNWKMGRKISVDSATLMNKGLEVIEARWLFNARPDQIEVVIHPQSIVHSLVAFRDGSVLAQMGNPDMRTPIAHALAWPQRIEAGVPRLELAKMAKLEFREPSMTRFPCLSLAFEALNAPGYAAVVLNAANEIAVESFLGEKIGFNDIPRVIGETLEQAESRSVAGLDDIIACDVDARRLATGQMKTMSANHV